MDQEYLSTRELADLVRVQSQTIRRGLCVNGNYLGLVPMKLKNDRLLWSKSEARKVVAFGKTA